jgi:membrane protease YdiL (CAAX protease family)
MSGVFFPLPPGVSAFLLTFVEAFFIIFVVISFVGVSVYAARRMAAGKLICPENAPLPLAIQPRSSAWIFAICVMGLIVVQSKLFPLVVMVGTACALIQNQRTVEVQFGFHRLPIVRSLAYAMIVFGAVMLVETPLSDASTWLLEFLKVPHPEQDSVETFRQYTGLSDILGFMLLAVVFNPIIEEIFFRGFLLTFFKTYASPIVAIVLSGGVFALAHLNLNAVIPLWFLGIVLGVAYEHTGSLLVPITIHGCFNLATGLSLLLDRGSGS